MSSQPKLLSFSINLTRKPTIMTENELAKIVVHLGLKVHRKLGPGLLESVYEECLCHELKKEGVNFKRQHSVPIRYDGELLNSKLRLDIILEDKLIVELKSVKSIQSIDLAQTLTYLRLTNCKLALLINFNTTLFKQGIHRIIDNKKHQLN
jgi:GxxExxY protein